MFFFFPSWGILSNTWYASLIINLDSIFLFSLINPWARFQEKPQQNLSCYFELTKKCSSSLLQIIRNAIIIIIIKEVKEVKGNTYVEEIFSSVYWHRSSWNLEWYFRAGCNNWAIWFLSTGLYDFCKFGVDSWHVDLLNSSIEKTRLLISSSKYLASQSM